MQIYSEFTVRYGQASEAGVKNQNEDCLGIRIPQGNALTSQGIAAVLADGVSSAEAGREAAEICVQGFLNDYYSTPETWQVKTAGHRIMVAINRWLYGKGQAFSEARKGYVSAMSAIVLKSRSLHCFHVGDVRIYLYRNQSLEALTRDHRTWVSRETSYLSRAMGLDVHLDVDYRSVSIEAGDLVFLCTDGVHEFLSDTELTDFLSSITSDLDATCRQIVAHALRKGSSDNLSCQLIEVGQLPDSGDKAVYKALSQLPFPPVLELGMQLQGYAVERVLKESPRSQLYLVRDVDSGELLTMKTPSERYNDDPAYIERFLIEEWVGRRVSSPYLVTVIPKKETAQFLFYLMEYVDGQTLSDWMTANPQPEMGKVVHIIDQIIQGVRALHRKETLHQDLKPDNILIDQNGNVKIIDYGSVSVAGIKESNVPFQRQLELGTRQYSAPEYLLQRQTGTRSDLFSIGVIAYQLFCGKAGHPYGDKFIHAESVRHFSLLKYEPASFHNPLVPAWIDGALERSTRIHPDGRHAALSEFLIDLKQPNPNFIHASMMPMLERHPLRFWKLLSLGLTVTVVILLLCVLGS